MKTCSRCKVEKELSCFSKNRSHRDGLKLWCKDCCREYRQSKKGKEADHRASHKYRQTDAGKTTNRRNLQKYRRLNPEKRKAHDAVRYALRVGKLIRPNHCESCFKKCRPEGHHESYEESRRLDVVWLCRECHVKRNQESETEALVC